MRLKFEPFPDRRQLLKFLSGSLGGLATGMSLPVGCASERTAEETRVPLDSVPLDGRLRVLDGENPVELRRAADGVVSGRSLWCTHFGCEVSWNEDRGVYLCPCHDGVYGADGRPVSGPPVRSLASVPLQVRDGEVLIGVEGVEGIERMEGIGSTESDEGAA